MSRYHIGYNPSGVPYITNSAVLTTDLGSQFGGTITNAAISARGIPTALGINGKPNAWSDLKLCVRFLRNGKVMFISIKYDPSNDELYRDEGLSVIGSGTSFGCGGSCDCMEIIDDNLNVTDCDCPGSGSCSGAIGAQT